MPTGADAGAGSQATHTRPLWPAHALAAAVVVVGVAVNIIRPLAPDLGPPPPPQTSFDAAFLARAAAYRQPVYAAGVVALLVRMLIAVAVAATPWGRRVVAGVVDRVGAERPARAAAVVIVGTVVVTDLVLLPLVFWIGFVHDGAYGLRTQGLGGWLYDWVVFHAPVWLGIAALAVAGYAVARRWPRLWPPLAGVAVGALAGLLAFVAPVVLEPLIHRFVPLPEGPVRAEVERVLAAAREDVDAILVADASRRTTRQNAYISGLGASRRIVVYDTLVSRRPPAEVGVVLAHELAHQRNGDLWRMVALSAAGGVVVAYVLAIVVRRRAATGRQASPTDPRGAAVVLLVALLLNAAGAPLQSWFSRRAEAAADLGSLMLTDYPDVFTDMQIALAEANLTEPLPPAWVTVWRGSHPPPMARIGMAQWWRLR